MTWHGHFVGYSFAGTWCADFRRAGQPPVADEQFSLRSVRQTLLFPRCTNTSFFSLRPTNFLHRFCSKIERLRHSPEFRSQLFGTQALDSVHFHGGPTPANSRRSRRSKIDSINLLTWILGRPADHRLGPQWHKTPVKRASLDPLLRIGEKGRARPGMTLEHFWNRPSLLATRHSLRGQC
jgi:hypothetical protein